jgi:hypothetical protein
MDKLGERLKSAARAAETLSEEDRRALLDLRSSFVPAYREAVERITVAIGQSPTGRPEKTPESILAKLVREGTKLSRMQDIAGCRLVLDTRPQQDEIVARLADTFGESVVRVDDRRQDPRHGYRAVHLVLRLQGRFVEVQVRTTLQDTWANLVESYADDGGDLKHGVEPSGTRGLLDVLSRASDRIAWAEENWLQSAPLASWGPIERSRFFAGMFRGIMAMVTYYEQQRR